MSSWSSKRKLLYATIATVVVVGGLGIPSFLIFYKAPTCFDGVKNGGEQGIDCGGRCTRLCQSSFLAPSVAWTRLEQVVPEIYNVATYIINPNSEGQAKNVPYRMTLYDEDGSLIVEEKGAVTLPSHRNTLAFAGAVKTGKRIPTRALFEFTSAPDWNKSPDTLASISVVSKYYGEEANNSSLSVRLKNNGLLPLYNIGTYVVLYDKSGNAIGFSKTLLDEVPPQSTVTAPFTWNFSRKGEVISIEVLYVAE